MKLNEKLGERKIIKIIQSHLDSMPKMPIPFGDDVSAYDIGNGNLAVLKTDMLVDKTDVPPGMSLWQAARKAVVMNISDFAAKGVRPTAILVSLGLPRNLRERVGTAKKNTLMPRSGAKPGDLLAVTGFFGKTSAGLKILLHNLEAPPKIRKTIVDSVLMPYARLKEGLALSRTKAVTASIDSSDGLAWSVHEIAKASNVGFLINTLPIAEDVKTFARLNKLDPTELTLYGGEEYELVLAIKPKLWKKAEKAVKEVGRRLLLIGKATAEKQVLLEAEDKRIIIEPRGYEHFKRAKV